MVYTVSPHNFVGHDNKRANPDWLPASIEEREVVLDVRSLRLNILTTRGLHLAEYFAINQVLYALVRLLQNTMKLTLKPEEMKVALEDPDDLRFKNDLHLTMGRDDGLWIKFTGLSEI